MSIGRVALVFDDKCRPETTGVYCRSALGKLADVEHFLPSGLNDIPRQGFDLYLNIDDGLRYRLPQNLRPSAWWAIDTHIDFGWSLEKSQDFDFVFAAQNDGSQRLKQAGIESAVWLPLACDPEIHRKHDIQKEYDVCFVGNLFPGQREELLELLQRHYSNSFIGRRYFDEMAEIYSASRIVFNRSVANALAGPARPSPCERHRRPRATRDR